jgi:RNA polymerase sigma factor (TIGR02999 family)
MLSSDERIEMEELVTRPPQAGGHAADVLFARLYHELLRLARREVHRNGAIDHVGAGTLVHEAWLDLQQRPSLGFDEPGRFLAYAARTMRGLVIDRLRARQAMKRGAGKVVALDTQGLEQAEAIAGPELPPGLPEALDELASIDAALAQVVELRFFGGFTLAQIAGMQGVSERTAQRQWDKARLLLHRALTEGSLFSQAGSGVTGRAVAAAC